jgi:hypothetical protein
MKKENKENIEIICEKRPDRFEYSNVVVTGEYRRVNQPQIISHFGQGRVNINALTLKNK